MTASSFHAESPVAAHPVEQFQGRFWGVFHWPSKTPSVIYQTREIAAKCALMRLGGYHVKEIDITGTICSDT